MRECTRLFLDRFLSSDFPPEIKQIILFGSEAYGQPNVLSDIDLAFVSDEKTHVLRCKADELIDSAFPPCDYNIVFVNPTDEYDKFDVRKDIFEKGVLLYERPE